MSKRAGRGRGGGRGMGRGQGGGRGMGRGQGGGRGMGRGQGGGRGMGRGRGGGRGMGRGRGGGREPESGLGFDPALDGSPVPESQGAAQDAQVLEAQAQAMMDRLRAIDRRISEIDGSSAEPPAPRELRSGKPPDGEDGVLRATVIVDKERCLSCGICAEICPEHAITISDTAEIDSNRCNGCGDCVEECPTEALSLPELKVATVL